MLVLLLALAVLCPLSSVLGQEGEKPKLPKPFGVGVGTSFIGGRDTDSKGTDVALRVYGWYINYRTLIGQVSQQEQDDYARYYSGNECIGSCPANSYCKKSICVCDERDEHVQIYGRCWKNGTSAYWVGNKEKYRKPDPPPLPPWCWCYRKDKNGHTHKEKCTEHRGNPACQEVTFPDEFDHNTQFCKTGDNAFCLGKDINMYCSQNTIFDRRPEWNRHRNVCACRKDMKFDTRNMECRIFLDVDCTYETKDNFTDKGDILAVLRGEKALDEKAGLTPGDIKQAVCVLFDGEVEAYNAHIVGAFEWTILGMGAAGFFAICCGSICAACCCCKCCASVKEKIRQMDPRTHIKGMDRETQLAALGAVAANEYIEGKGERDDAARLQAMQGGYPGGAPQGYAPVPTGYPQGEQQGFYPPEGAGMPLPPEGYGPAQQGYGQQPVYPQLNQAQPGGYIPPEDPGILGNVMNMAPELALAGAGAYTGNNTMAGMGVIAAAEKYASMDDKEDRIRAAAARGVPPPPMGYAGGPPVPAGQPPQMMNMPPPTANYPRQ